MNGEPKPVEAPAAAATPTYSKIFISYRRSDVAHAAHRLYDYLADRFTADAVFIDLDTIAPGADFVSALDDALKHCRVLLAVIGPGWVDAADPDGVRRLSSPTDLVRREIESALDRDVVVIPVLVDAAMPGEHDLPDSMAAFVRRQALALRLASFRADCARLGDHISIVVAQP
ncbi:toll/interleukin-1 receptor domain-containing protein [Catellatospora tritici]|uniref:toll/interleukin-1 receptor domain-containing protein n=1 Tax=Catellatospora tritici TaxID=2851566 RepID=UPI001C2D4DCE|nr:toll/interleukin-1 receptor domain-containing protein [Catellatospora tritici]MBV1856340.1 toll/interleukin-1 receptor domain-containing protein [Catellatospora tritici]